jgi:hypothetical protein
MAVNSHGICVTNVINNNLTENDSNILHHLIPRKSRVKITAIIYCSIFITFAPGVSSVRCTQTLDLGMIR